jgi:hypothetical protein
MSAVITERPPAVLPATAAPTPLFTRHMRGAIEGERDRRRQSRSHGVHRYTSTLPSSPPLRLVEPPVDAVQAPSDALLAASR